MVTDAPRGCVPGSCSRVRTQQPATGARVRSLASSRSLQVVPPRGTPFLRHQHGGRLVFARIPANCFCCVAGSVSLTPHPESETGVGWGVKPRNTRLKLLAITCCWSLIRVQLYAAPRPRAPLVSRELVTTGLAMPSHWPVSRPRGLSAVTSVHK